MSKTVITEEQITDLYDFCNENGVYYYDVQVELVDHLACAIERKWEEDSSLSYEEALWSVYDDFGPSGFRKISSSKEREIRKKYDHLRWKYIGEFYRLPKIILTLFITFILYILLRWTEKDLFVCLIIFSTFIIGLFIYLASVHPERRRLKINSNKSFLLYDHFIRFKWMILSVAAVPFSLLSSFSVFIKEYNNWNSFEWVGEAGLAFFISFFMVFAIAMTVNIPQRISEDFVREYPQFVN